MVMLTCLRTRRRIGAYLDGALDSGAARSIAVHLSRCAACQGESENLRRVRVLLQRTLSLGRAEPDWSGFWPGIVRSVEDARLRKTPPVAAPRGWWRPRWTLGGALAAVLLASVTLWQMTSGPLAPDAPIVVSSAQTDDPRGTVMVYSTHERDVAVVWVLGLDESSD